MMKAEAFNPTRTLHFKSVDIGRKRSPCLSMPMFTPHPTLLMCGKIHNREQNADSCLCCLQGVQSVGLGAHGHRAVVMVYAIILGKDYLETGNTTKYPNSCFGNDFSFGP